MDDWIPAPNIRSSPEIYALENLALERDGRLEVALRQVADWRGKTLLDIGSGTGFWVERYDAAAVIGVEPDPALRALSSVPLREGSAEHLPVPDSSVDVVHARFAYFFGPGAEPGLAEVRRVLAPGGVFVAVDNSWRGGEFAELLRDCSTGNAAMDPDAAARWWALQGAHRVEVEAGWRARSPGELESILRIEFPADTVDRFLAAREPSASLTYAMALWVVHGSKHGTP